MSEELQPAEDRRLARLEATYRGTLWNLGLCVLLAWMVASHSGHPIVWAALLALQIVHSVLYALGILPRRRRR